ncbi:MAG: calcium/sodium antiporter [Candidatus Kapabacteria bacterium]|jgi:cation:H+ antiporter|nr:calcium/sodium antiporter [Candidatus Kapabacteria bacterium]
MPPSADITFPILFLIAGALLLYIGAEGLVRGSASVALRMRIAPLIVGLTIIAFGTSSPELVVSIKAALKGNAEIALGNVIGSNICNIALIIGVAAIIRPIKVDKNFIKADMLLMVGVTVLLILLMFDGTLDAIDGVIMFAGIIVYNVATIVSARKSSIDSVKIVEGDDVPEKSKSVAKDVVFIVVGLAVLILGANIFVDGAVDIAKFLGASDLIIGLTVIALGTSLPELATSIVAAIKGHAEISIGNAVGSNIYNILLILGVAAMVTPINSVNVNIVDVAVMLAVALILFPLSWTQQAISRKEGVFLLLVYLSYMYYLSTQMSV